MGEFQQQIFLTRSREERKEKKLYGLSAPSFEQDFSATESRHLRVLRGFA